MSYRQPLPFDERISHGVSLARATRQLIELEREEKREKEQHAEKMASIKKRRGDLSDVIDELTLIVESGAKVHYEEQMPLPTTVEGEPPFSTLPDESALCIECQHTEQQHAEGTDPDFDKDQRFDCQVEGCDCVIFAESIGTATEVTERKGSEGVRESQSPPLPNSPTPPLPESDFNTECPECSRRGGHVQSCIGAVGLTREDYEDYARDVLKVKEGTIKSHAQKLILKRDHDQEIHQFVAARNEQQAEQVSTASAS